MIKELAAFIFGKSQENFDLRDAFFRNVDAKSKLLHKAERSVTAFDEIAQNLKKKRTK